MKNNALIRLVVGLMFLLFSSSSYSAMNEVKKMELMLNLFNKEHEFTKPDQALITEPSTVEFDLPKRVLMHIYYDNKERTIREDYFNINGDSKVSTGLIVSNITIYSKEENELLYSIWVDDKGKVLKFIRREYLTENISKKIQLFKRLEYIFRGKGESIGRIEYIVTVNHIKAYAGYTRIEYDKEGKIVSKDEGDANYSEYLD